MNAIATLLGCSVMELRAILWTLDGYIAEEAALYAFILHEGNKISWKPSKVIIYMSEYNIESDEDDNGPHYEFYRNIMMKLGYHIKEPDRDIWDFECEKDDCIPVTIKIRRHNRADLYIKADLNATPYEFYGDIDNIRNLLENITDLNNRDRIRRAHGELILSRGNSEYLRNYKYK